MLDYRIHPVGRGHSKILADLHKGCFTKGWGHLEFESFFERAGVFAAIAYHKESKAVGFVLCWLIEDQCDLLSMGVLADYRRDGVGQMLLDYALENARHMGAKHMVLEVNVNNKAARELYEAQGFEQFSTRKDYYSNADGTRADASCMRKPLA
ncbi:MAG: ribosomal-protein-alanine acetyltransferase [Azospirillum brasilense]|nr:MAG: ribosomal-protein-alanine acetyltransferase [Azospirillum brasilense]